MASAFILSLIGLVVSLVALGLLFYGFVNRRPYKK